MKPPKFDYASPATLGEAVELLAAHEEAKVLAGGQSLVPLLNMRLSQPSLLVDINRVQDSEGLSVNGSITCGPLVRVAEAESSSLLGRRSRLLEEALQWIGHPQIRNRATVLGSLAHADPAAELPVAATAMAARMTILGSSGTRSLDAHEFFVHVMETAVQPDELLISVEFPADPPHRGSAFMEVARRHGDFAVASVGVVLTLDRGVITAARIAMGGVGPTPLRAFQAEEALVGNAVEESLFDHAARLAAANTSAQSDIHGTAEYRRDIIQSLTRKTLASSAARTSWEAA